MWESRGTRASSDMSRDVTRRSPIDYTAESFPVNMKPATWPATLALGTLRVSSSARDVSESPGRLCVDLAISRSCIAGAVDLDVGPLRMAQDLSI